MATGRKVSGGSVQRESPPAVGLEAREDQLIGLAVNQAEQMLRKGNAPTQIVVHYLKLATTKNQLEKEKLKKDYAFVIGNAGAELSGDQASLTEAFVTARDAGTLRPDLKLWAVQNPGEIPTVGGLTAYGEKKSRGIATVGDEGEATKIEFGIRTLRGDEDEVGEIEALNEKRGGVIDLTREGIQATMDRRRKTANETILGIQKGAKQ